MVGHNEGDLIRKLGILFIVREWGLWMVGGSGGVEEGVIGGRRSRD